jgi:hypothetical protein
MPKSKKTSARKKVQDEIEGAELMLAGMLADFLEDGQIACPS